MDFSRERRNPSENQNVTFPSGSFDPLTSSQQMAETIASVTNQKVEDVMFGLRAEYKQPGVAVVADFRRRSLTPYVWSEDLTNFYQENQSFVYELALYNRNPIKRELRSWISRWLDKYSANGLDILTVGDGLGFDSLEFAKHGHRVSYFEVAGYSASFARKLFEKSGVHIEMPSNLEMIPRETFDVVVCLDVLEHVPDPQSFVNSLVSQLKSTGVLIINAPFFLIHPNYPSHLRSNRRYCGSLTLYTQNGLKLLDGGPWWSPIVLGRANCAFRVDHGAIWRRLVIRLMKPFLMLGRIGAFPCFYVHHVRSRLSEWFDEKIQ